MKSFIQFLRDQNKIPKLDEIALPSSGETLQIISEGKLVDGRFNKNIRIDHATHGAGQTHAHIYGRKGHEWGVVNIDGSSSHGKKCKLHSDDATALRNNGFAIRGDNIVEWTSLEDDLYIIYG